MNNNLYCVKCKKPTETVDLREEKTKNGKNILKGKCAICGIRKTQFISSKTQKGNNLNKIINNLPVELHLPGHNFTGPGTRLDKRLNPDLTPKNWSKPINRVDEASMNHDICYLKNKDIKTRNDVCDGKMLKDLKNIYNPTIREKMERGIVSRIIGTKKRFGMGQELKDDKKKNYRPNSTDH